MGQFCRKCGEAVTCIVFATDLDDPDTYVYGQEQVLANGETCYAFEIGEGVTDFCDTETHCFNAPHCCGSCPPEALNGTGDFTRVGEGNFVRLAIKVSGPGSVPIDLILKDCNTNAVIWQGVLPAGSNGFQVPLSTPYAGGNVCLQVLNAPEDGTGPQGVYIQTRSENCFPATVVTSPGTGGSSVECCNTQMFVSGADELTLTQSNGAPVSVPLADLGIEPLCDQIDALPDLPANVAAETTIVVGTDGNCYKAPAPCHIVVDAGNAPWDDTNGAWVDPNTLPDGCSMLLQNSLESGPAGSSSFWRSLSDGTAQQWHQGY